MGSEQGRRRYESARRASQAEETRRNIAAAVRRVFVAQGWAALTIRDVARAGGVSVPTVYATYGNKAGLVRALADAAELLADPERQSAELAEGSPRQQLAAMAGYDRRLFERAGDVIAMVREAGRAEPELAALYADGRRRADSTRVRVFEAWPDGSFRPGLDVPTAIDVYAALCNIDVYTVLTAERGWTPDRVEQWWTEALARELLRLPDPS
ncbi:TetR/AcrR family transcriptional regulator [Paractinoplanes rishiriensis]|uniref:HTH tetR-type domain-containing protein n=1 Tax=Paractinoplanes rishiriensis TaxID=1050105 RepID=A0A919JTD6_9ACTN|nr:TetR/AcrR family transcriptional regulator [Actinoplanes rishiriensis]GIE93027.1 hypothetical protein Ari01nite_04920 [Actinoplanes rishiriensis]